MQIKPSAIIRQDYNEIAALCRSTGEPVFLTKNGEGDLVFMDIEAFTCREKMLKLREELLAVEEDRLAGRIFGWGTWENIYAILNEDGAFQGRGKKLKVFFSERVLIG